MANAKKRITSLLMVFCLTVVMTAGILVAAPVTVKAAGEFHADQKIDISNKTFQNGIASSSDGGTFAGNGGGLVHIPSPPNVSGSSCTITTSTFLNNTAELDGGAIYLYDVKTVEILECVFTGNSAGGYGGALYVAGSITVEITTCTFMGNTGNYAVYIEGDATFTNCVFGPYDKVYVSGTATYNNCTFQTPDPSLDGTGFSPDFASIEYEQRHADFWLGHYYVMAELPIGSSYAIDTYGQSIDHIRHFILDIVCQKGLTLTVKHNGQTYVFTRSNIYEYMRGHNHLFRDLGRYKR